MKVTLFKNVIGENRPSMEVYADKLLRHMPENVEGFTIKARSFPFVKHYFHKEIIYPRIAKRHQGDVNHISDHSYASLLRYLNPKKTMVTCHDLIPLDNPQEASLLGRLRFRHNVRYLSCAAKIIAISNYTKNCILKHFDYPRDNIYVIYYGLSKTFRALDNASELKNKYDIKNKTLLHVGSSFPRKNVDFILKVLLKRADLTLIKVGRFTKEQLRFISKNGLNNRIIQFQYIEPGNELLIELYNIADILFMPSLAEGFCMPILEAMACGCPVICSDIEVFYELYDGAALFINPKDLDDAADKIGMLLNNSKLREDLINKGLAKSKEFSWQKCAQQTYRVYEDVFYGR